MEEKRSRRAILAAVAGTAAGAVVAIAGAPLRTVAAQDETLALGKENESRSTTRLTRSTSGPALMSQASGPGVALSGRSPSGIGVYGLSDAGHGVLGSSVDGSGVEAWGLKGWALRVRRGRIQIDSVSGVATIPSGDDSVSVRLGPGVDATSFVLLTPMASLGGRDLWFSIEAPEKSFTIHLGSAVEDPVRVSWLMLG